MPKLSGDMNDLVWLVIRAFVVAVMLTPICRDIFKSYGVEDQPDQARKLHGQPIPRVGGIAIVLSYFAAFLVNWPGGVHVPQIDLIWKLLPAVAVIFMVGLVDDFLSLKPWQKLAGQLLGAGLAYAAGVRIMTFNGGEVPVWCSLPFTILWLLLCTNAFNLVDGLDGLAAGLGLFATVTIFVAALLNHNLPLAYATLPLAGSLLGFLCFNFNPATIFLGDSGSLPMGFLLGCYGVVWIQKSFTLLGLTAPLMAMALPLLDVALCVVRRFLRNRPIFSADRGHIHHRLLDRGLSPRQAVMILYAIAGTGAAFSIVQTFVGSAYVAIVVVLLFCLLAWAGVQYLGYAELALVGRLVRDGQLQQVIQSRLLMDTFESNLAAAHSLEDAWRVIEKSYQGLGLHGARLVWEGDTLESFTLEAANFHCWTLRVPLPGGNHIELMRRAEESTPPAVPLLLDVDALSRALYAGLSEALSLPETASAPALGSRA